LLLLSLLGIAWFCGFRIRKKKRSRWLVDERPGKPFFFVRSCSYTDACNETKKKSNYEAKEEKEPWVYFFFSRLVTFLLIYTPPIS
jgi:hypothetical protein